MDRPDLHFVSQPRRLSLPSMTGRVVVVDVAFAHGPAFFAATQPFLAALDERLALWIDHHDHPEWARYLENPRFILESKLTARACPQLITPAIVARLGQVHHVMAHADFDGCMAAAKFLRDGEPPYVQADEDARFADAPGQNFSCSERGRRLLDAFEQAHRVLPARSHQAFLKDAVLSWVEDCEPKEFKSLVDQLVQDRRCHIATLDTLCHEAVAPSAQMLLLDVDRSITQGDKKYLLRQLESRSRIALIRQGRWMTVATYDDGPAGLDLASLPGMVGQRGLAWGKASLQDVLRHLHRLLLS